MTESWILKDKRLSEYYNQLFLAVDKRTVNWGNLNDAFAYEPRIMGNSGSLYYLYQSYVLKGYGSSMDDQMINMKENLERLDPQNRDFLILSAVPENINSQEEYLTGFMPFVSQEWVKEYMTESLREAKQHMDEINAELANSTILVEESVLGNPHKAFSFGAESYISEEEDVVTFLQAIQNKFAGQTIIIDVWATWCAPCIQDMKESGPAKKQLNELPVEVVYVCAKQGSEVDAWEKRIAETKTGGTHIFINDKLTAALMEKFKLPGFPSYLLFDKKGTYHKDVVHSISRIDIEKIEKLSR